MRFGSASSLLASQLIQTVDELCHPPFSPKLHDILRCGSELSGDVLPCDPELYTLPISRDKLDCPDNEQQVRIKSHFSLGSTSFIYSFLYLTTDPAYQARIPFSTNIHSLQYLKLINWPRRVSFFHTIFTLHSASGI